MSSSPQWPEYEIPNPQVQGHADQIADAAIFLYRHLPEINCVPSVLLEGALAIELYLKSLCSRTVFHLLEGIGGFQLTAKPTKGHRLEELFDTIDQPIRDELQQAYASAPVVAKVPLLRDALGRYSNLFVEIRYIFESQGGGGNSITDLINLVRFFRREITNMPRRYRDG